MARVNYDQPPAAAAGSRSPAYPLSVLVSLSVRLPARSGVSLRVRALVRVSVPSARPTVSKEALPRNYASRRGLPIAPVQLLESRWCDRPPGPARPGPGG